MARPKTTRARRKAHVVSFRISDADFFCLSHKAAAANLSVSALARKLALSRLPEIAIQNVASCDPALLKQLYHIGHNLNQLVKNAHIFKRVSPQVESLCQRIEILMDEAIGKDK